jgi:hypothetical protein
MTAALSRILALVMTVLPLLARAQEVLPAPVGLANPGGSVETVVVQPDGKVLIGGSFAKIGGAVRHNLARLNADGSVDPSFHPDIDSTVYAIAVSPTVAYIGGRFQHVDGVDRPGLAAVDLATGNLLPWNPAAASPAVVYAIAVAGSTVYVGGNFPEMGGVARTALAAVDADSGATLPFDASISDGVVSSIAVADGVVYAGGIFPGTVDSEVRNGLLAVDATTGVIQPLAPLGALAWVFDLAIVDSTLYVAGNGLRSGNDTMVAIDLPGGTVLPWNPDINGRVTRMAIDGDSIYIAGLFSSAGGSTHRSFAKISRIDASAASWDPDVDRDYIGRGIAVSADHAYIGGAFTRTQGVETGGFARVDRDTAILSDSPQAEFDSYVRAVAYQDDGKALVGGSFRYVDGTPHQNIARLLADGSVDPTFDSSVDAPVTSLVVRNSTIYVGGIFRNVGPLARNGLAAIDVATGATMAWNPGGDASSARVYALAASDDTLYAGGSFAALGGSTAVNLAAIDLASGMVLPSWSANVDGDVSALALEGNTLYVGGEFATVAGQPRTRLAAVGAADATLLAWNPGADATVYSLAARPGSVYAAGRFTQIGGQPRSSLAEIDAMTGAVSAWSPILDATLTNAVALDGNALYVGGDFTTVDGEPRMGIARFDLASHDLAPWRVAVDGSVSAIGLQPDRVLIGGGFSHVGNLDRYGIAAVTTMVDAIFGDGFETAITRAD